MTGPLDAPLRLAIRDAARADEDRCVRDLLARVPLGSEDVSAIDVDARALVEGVRSNRRRFGGLDDFLQEYGLTTGEGVALMCLAEALLRIPDAETADRLIADKLGGADWEAHLGHSGSWFVNASSWALMLTGHLLEDLTDVRGGLPSLSRIVARLGEPVIRQAVRQAMRVLGHQFVMGRTIGDALARARDDRAEGYTHSFDMLGEAARTACDAEQYFQSYRDAIEAIGRNAGEGTLHDRPGISVKLSALHPRYEYAQRQRALPVLVERLGELARACAGHGIALTVDAEEADRLDLSLDVVEAVFADPRLAGWNGFGLAVQAYQKRALPVIEWLEALAGNVGRPIAVRLVKGAYWDSEIKWTQERGLADYPVFTRKSSTDVSFLACAARMLAAQGRIYPMFATHNAHTLAAVRRMAGQETAFEFQRLHGMGEPLYHQLVGPDSGLRCRIYAPVGSHEDLLPYLVRRLLENGANSSFVNRLRDDAAPVDDIVADPLARTRSLGTVRHPRIALPRDMYRPERQNSAGIDLADPLAVAELYAAMEAAQARDWRAQPVIGGEASGRGDWTPVRNPSRRSHVVGEVRAATADDVAPAFAAARRGFAAWDALAGDERAVILDRAADLLEARRPEFMALAVREAGKTVPDALAEVREAADFCRYYAARARESFARPLVLPGPTGEANSLSLHGRGVFVCISPWNFPLAIFTGQVAAALAAGNAVIAKPAEQTPLIAAHAVAVLHEAGVPLDALSLLPGSGGDLGPALLARPELAGVAFTGSVATAHAINRALAARDGAIVPLIAETGGQNAMVVDASALPEQVVDDAIRSAFGSAGQRCSALRVMFVQDDVADRIVDLLAGASRELVLGDPWQLSTDIGPIIDERARERLAGHASAMAADARTVLDLTVPEDCADGVFFGPKAFEIDAIARLEGEVFGPVLHIVRWRADRLDAVTDAINATGYGLTVGVHSRIEETQQRVARRVRAGNAYVNRSMIGAVVGVQPFGGEGLSGTGPKAGGPHYLPRFAVERALSVNTAAAGGNTDLMNLDERS